MPVARSLELPIHFVALNGDPHKGITVNMTWPFTVTFLTLKHMEKRNQTVSFYPLIIATFVSSLHQLHEPRASTWLLATKRLATTVA